MHQISPAGSQILPGSRTITTPRVPPKEIVASNKKSYPSKPFQVAISTIYSRDMQEWLEHKRKFKEELKKDEIGTRNSYLETFSPRHIPTKAFFRKASENTSEISLPPCESLEPKEDSSLEEIQFEEKQLQKKEERKERIKLLIKAQIPLTVKEINNLLVWADSLQLKLRKKEKQKYPCLFTNGIHNIEAHSPEELFLYFPISEDPSKHITTTDFKEFRYVWLLTLKPKRFVYVIVNCSTPSKIKAAKNEVKFLPLFNEHPHSAMVHKIFHYPNNPIIIMKNYKNADFLKILSIILKGDKSFSDTEKLKWAEQILTILAHIHENNIAHRDVKPENLLVTGKLGLALTDYGFTNYTTHEQMQDFVGSLGYVANEILTKSYSGDGKALDVWSAGCVLYILFAEKKFPWFNTLVPEPPHKANFSKAKEEIKEFNLIKPSRKTQPLFHLVRSMLDIDLEKRPTMNEALEFIREYRQKNPEDDSTYKIKSQFVFEEDLFKKKTEVMPPSPDNLIKNTGKRKSRRKRAQTIIENQRIPALPDNPFPHLDKRLAQRKSHSDKGKDKISPKENPEKLEMPSLEKKQKPSKTPRSLRFNFLKHKLSRSSKVKEIAEDEKKD